MIVAEIIEKINSLDIHAERLRDETLPSCLTGGEREIIADFLDEYREMLLSRKVGV